LGIDQAAGLINRQGVTRALRFSVRWRGLEEPVPPTYRVISLIRALAANSSSANP
jgi:hypothetical protein